MKGSVPSHTHWGNEVFVSHRLCEWFHLERREVCCVLHRCASTVRQNVKKENSRKLHFHKSASRSDTGLTRSRSSRNTENWSYSTPSLTYLESRMFEQLTLEFDLRLRWKGAPASSYFNCKVSDAFISSFIVAQRVISLVPRFLW